MRWALIDFSHKFYRPLPLRIGIFAFLVAWTGVEVSSGSMAWAALFAALAAYVGWGFFLSGQVTGDPPENGQEK